MYEDDNCSILYNLWKENGEIGFIFYNKTSQNIYIHKDQCFFVKNGFAYDYFQNRVYSSSSNKYSSTKLTNINSFSTGQVNTTYYYGEVMGTSSTNRNTYGASTTTSLVTSEGVSIPEKAIICIPPHTSKVISEFDINNSIYRNCDLRLKPSYNKNSTMSFDKDNSPLVFGNRIAYTIGDAEELIRVNNDFYVSNITNYPNGLITKVVMEENCGVQTGRRYRIFTKSGPDQFYINYYPNGMTAY